VLHLLQVSGVLSFTTGTFKHHKACNQFLISYIVLTQREQQIDTESTIFRGLD
jgi:hypothetical protein